MVMLASKMPKLRVYVAEQLYLCCMLMVASNATASAPGAACWSSGRLAAVQDTLGAHRWGDDDIAKVKEARLQIINLFGLQPPKVKGGTARAAVGKAANSAIGSESYQGLLNDFARGL
jgi:hypothetical protein